MPSPFSVQPIYWNATLSECSFELRPCRSTLFRLNVRDKSVEISISPKTCSDFSPSAIQSTSPPPFMALTAVAGGRLPNAPNGEADISSMFPPRRKIPGK